MVQSSGHQDYCNAALRLRRTRNRPLVRERLVRPPLNQLSWAHPRCEFTFMWPIELKPTTGGRLCCQPKTGPGSGVDRRSARQDEIECPELALRAPEDRCGRRDESALAGSGSDWSGSTFRPAEGSWSGWSCSAAAAAESRHPPALFPRTRALREVVSPPRTTAHRPVGSSQTSPLTRG